MAVTGQLWFTTEGGDADTRIVHVNNDGTSQTIVVDNGGAGTGDDKLISSFTADIGVDTTAGFYFAILSSPLNDHAYLVRGVVGSNAAPTIVVDFPDSIIVNTLQLDAINHKIYFGYQDGSGTPDGNITGIRVYDYNPLNGAITDQGFLTTAVTDSRPNESGFFVLDPHDFALDSSIGRLFYSEKIDGLSEGLFRLDLANPNVATQLVSQAQFPDDGSGGYIYDVEVDQTTDLVYFSTQSQSPSGSAGYDPNQNAIWYISENASSGTAVKVTLSGLPGGNTFYPGDMTFDQNTRQIYVESEEGGSGSADDVIYVFQLDGPGTTATLIQTIVPSPAFAGSAANIEGMTFVVGNNPHTGGISIIGTATEDQVLTAVSTLADPDGLGTLHYQWQHDVGSGFVNVGTDQATYTLGDSDVGGVVRVVTSYTDGQGFAESATSAATATIANVNDPHTGGASITGTATENQVLTAVSTLADPDGLGTLHYDWQRNTGSGFVSTGAADQSTYTLGDADVGGLVRVVVSYTDGGGTAETATSGATAAVAAVNDPHTGGVSVTGTTTEDQVLTAVSTLADVDGLGTLHYQWQHDVGSGFVNVGADQATYTLGDGDVGGLVRVVTSYTDGQGFAESATSAPTAAIANVNDPHTGGATITGTATEDQVLTAVSTLADVDGLGTLHYQWQRGFVNVGADQATYTLGDADVGGLVRVVVYYTDAHGTVESATSAATATIAGVNDPHTGGASVTGTATEDQVLTAVSTLADVDGLGLLHYDWQRDTGSGFVSTGAADQSTYTLGDADVGGVVRVVTSYTDGQGFAESATSAATAAVLNINDPHTGGVSITGTVAEHQVLTADTSTLVDADGLGTLHYQWQRDNGGGFVNVGLDQATYTLNAVDIGGAMRVVTSYTDGHGTAEAATSAPTAAVTAVDDPATVALTNIHAPILENASTAVHIKAADIVLTDVDGGTNDLLLSGLDANLFEIVGTELFIKAGVKFDFETNPVLNVNVQAQASPGGLIGAAAPLAINILDIAENKFGTSGKDYLIGTSNGDTISGLAGNDRIAGLGGNDRIIGGLGADVMTGGPGADVFVYYSISDSAPFQSGQLNNGGVFSAAAGAGLRDLITDFTHGVDKIDLSVIDANSKVAGNQHFAWRGTGNFTHSPGQLIERLYNPAGTAFDKTIIYGDVNGDMRADFQIELTGLKTITVSDFIL